LTEARERSQRVWPQDTHENSQVLANDPLSKFGISDLQHALVFGFGGATFGKHNQRVEAKGRGVRGERSGVAWGPSDDDRSISLALNLPYGWP
jgi:hypothetical protein